MKKNSFFLKLISLLGVLCMIAALSAVTVYAEPEGEGVVTDEAGDYAAPADDQPEVPQDVPQDTPQEEPQDTPAAQEQDTPQPEEPSYAPIYEYIYGYAEDMTSAYEEPEHLAELPAVTPSEVVQATAVVIPDVAVSDASLLSGSVMWLCVALGIAVIVGVLVSKRTRRRGV